MGMSVFASKPATPDGLSAIVNADRSVSLEWNDKSLSELGYRVERRFEGGPWEEIADLPANTLGWTDNAVTVDYRVRAYSILQQPSLVITDFGAVADDGLDDTPAILAAIAAAKSAGGGRVFIPAGTFLIMPQANTETAALTIDFDDLEMFGVGSESVLSFRSIGNTDPVSNWYSFVSADPQDRENGRPMRGHGIELVLTAAEIAQWDADIRNDPALIGRDNIVLRDFRLTGNTPPTGFSRWEDDWHRAEGWDITHKGIMIGADIATENIVVSGLTVDNWRGELIYSGGAAHGLVTIRDSIFHSTNSSAVSLSARLVLESCEIYAVANAGVECRFVQREPGKKQDAVIRRNLIEPRRGMLDPVNGLPIRGDWGVVIGSWGKEAVEESIERPEAVVVELEPPTVLVEDNLVRDCRRGALLIELVANNTTVTGNSFVDWSTCKINASDPLVKELEENGQPVTGIHMEFVTGTIDDPADTDETDGIDQLFVPLQWAPLRNVKIVRNLFVWERPDDIDCVVGNTDVVTGLPVHDPNSAVGMTTTGAFAPYDYQDWLIADNEAVVTSDTTIKHAFMDAIHPDATRQNCVIRDNAGVFDWYMHLPSGKYLDLASQVKIQTPLHNYGERYLVALQPDLEVAKWLDRETFFYPAQSWQPPAPPYLLHPICPQVVIQSNDSNAAEWIIPAADLALYPDGFIMVVEPSNVNTADIVLPADASWNRFADDVIIPAAGPVVHMQKVNGLFEVVVD